MAEGKLLTLGPPRVSVVVLEAGESAVETLLGYARQTELSAASLSAVGGFSESTLAFFDVDAKQYRDIPVNQQAEVLSLSGDIVRSGADWQVHAHAVLGLPDGSTRGGHLREATVRPTLEVMLTDAPSEVVRTYDPDSGLALIDMAASTPSAAETSPRTRQVRRGVVGDMRSGVE